MASKINYTDEQKSVIEADGNVFVEANAGTGKTATLVEKMRYDLQRSSDHRDILAITFSNKAANELKQRVDDMLLTHAYISTNNSFVVKEIVKPFFNKVYDVQYSLDDLEINYRNESLQSFEEGKETICRENKLLSYKNIQRNFVFELASDIVRKSKVCRLYLRARFKKIFIDEYQDCDLAMHKFFIYLYERVGINLVLFGDVKQAIYTWRGAYPEYMKEIRKRTDFKHFYLTKNFRSAMPIQNYANALYEETIPLILPDDDKIDAVKWSNLSNAIEFIKNELNDGESMAVLRRSNDDAKRMAETFSEILEVNFAYVPRLSINDITSSDFWFYQAVAEQIIDVQYNIYDFQESSLEVMEEEKFSSKRKAIKRLLKQIQFTADNNRSNAQMFQNIEELRQCGIRELADVCDVKLSKENLTRLLATLNDKEEWQALKKDMSQLKYTSMTIHAAKGLEYDQVVIFADDYYDYRKCAIDIYIHYVAATRAKKRLYIFSTRGINNGEKFLSLLKKRMSEYDFDLTSVVNFIYI